MGHYLNPPATTPEQARYGKSAWLEKNGVKLSEVPAWGDIPEDCIAVCCVNNGPFEAVAVAYKPSELEYFNGGDPTDNRPKTWFLVEKKVALPYVSPPLNS